MAGRIAYYGNIVRDGLVLNLDAAKQDSYPGSGTVWRDIANGVITGSLVNGPTFNPSNFGSIVFDGVNDLVNTSLSVQGITAFSTEVVFRTTTTYDTAQFYNCPSICGTAQGSGTSGDWLLAVKSGSLVSYDELTGGNNNISLNIYVSNNNWYYVQVTKTTDGIVTYYVNGTQILQLTGRTSALRTVATGSTIYGTNWMVGSAFWIDAAYRNFSGSIAFNRFYNRALTAQEITQNYNATKGRYGL
jgi:hypothetical protein